MTIRAIAEESRDAPTFNLSVEGTHTFFVVAGSTPVLVHNVDPWDILFTQDSYGPTFQNGPWAGRNVAEAVAEARATGSLPAGLELRAMRMGDGSWAALNNRTLAVAQGANLPNVNLTEVGEEAMNEFNAKLSESGLVWSDRKRRREVPMISEKRHGGALLLQTLEPKKLIGSMMSVVTETGEDWIHVVFFNERGVFELGDDGRETKLLLSRTLAMSLLALLRVALAQFAVLHGLSGSERDSTRGQGDESAGVEQIRVEGSRQTLCLVWPSAAEGVRRQDATGQVELRLRGPFGVAIERALLTSLAHTAAGAAVPSS